MLLLSPLRFAAGIYAAVVERAVSTELVEGLLMTLFCTST